MIKSNQYTHGRETYAVYYGDSFVLKRPLPNFGDAKKAVWLEKQHKTKEVVDAIRAVGNPVYNVPAMHFINDDEFQILEERAPGVPLTRELFRSLSRRQKFEIINSIGSFLVDMNELKPVKELRKYKISNEVKFNRLDSFVENKMSVWFTKNEVRQMSRIRDEFGNFEYDTRQAWSHGDLNPDNVFYDPDKSKISFIDFAEADYKFIYHDIFASLQIELEIYKRCYEVYTKLHNKSLYPVLSPKNVALKEIMKFRIMGVMLKRFIKAADDLRLNPANEKSAKNNLEKVCFMRKQMQQIAMLENQLAK